MVLVMGPFTGCGASEETVDTTPTTEYVPRETPESKLHEPAADFAGGTGTEADPYQISDAAQLALLNQRIVEESQDDSFDDGYTNACYILTGDISLNDTADFDSWANSAPEYRWEPIGKAAEGNRFGGVFDGNGHTISGMYINADANLDEIYYRSYGLFAGVEGTIKNLTIDRSYICVSGTVKNVGAVAGSMVLGQARIENCVSNAVIGTYDDGNVGGVAGTAAGTITGCSFGGTITQLDDAWSEMGGIAGAGGTISSCENSGTLSCPGGEVGGIAGAGEIVSDCINRGKILSADTAGGITAVLYQVGTNLELETTEGGVSSCINEGEINASAYAGGIVGRIGNDETDYAMILTDCENHGQIFCDDRAAGIVAAITCERGDITLENCVNNGDIACADKVGGVVCDLLGGINNQKGNATITGCENHGDITSTGGMYSGGIVTYFMLMGSEIDLRLTIEDCTNTGAITSQSNAGGILCFTTSMMGVTAENSEISDTSAVTLRGCVNTGEILGQSSNSYVGGIAAVFSAEGIPALFENCVNTGDVCLTFSMTEEEIQDTLESDVTFTITQMVGGIVGRLGEGLLLTTDLDEGSAANINAENAMIVFRNCCSSGHLTTVDYSGYVTDEGRQIWRSDVGGIIGNTCAEDAYAFLADACGYANAERGLGMEEFPDVGEKMSEDEILSKIGG